MADNTEAKKLCTMYARSVHSYLSMRSSFDGERARDCIEDERELPNGYKKVEGPFDIVFERELGKENQKKQKIKMLTSPNLNGYVLIVDCSSLCDVDHIINNVKKDDFKYLVLKHMGYSTKYDTHIWTCLVCFNRRIN